MRSLVIVGGAWLAVGCCLGTVGTPTLHPLSIEQLPAGFDETAVAPVRDKATQRAVGQAAASKAEAAVKPAALPPSPNCEVRLFAEQLATGDVLGIKNGALGAFFAERAPGTTTGLFMGVCIKRPGQPLRLPNRILIATDPEGPGLERFCRKDAEDFALLPPDVPNANLPNNQAIKVKACTWDGTFHSTRPFTFTLMSQPGTAVGDYVEVLRVYRNGDLMAAWNYASDQPRPDRVVVDGKLMRTGPLAATYPPHLAAMDLRVVPRETGITHVVEMEVRDDRARFQTKLSSAAKAAAQVALPPGSPERQSLDCLSAQLSAASAEIMSVVDKPALPQLPRGCTPLISAGGRTPLSDAYRDAKNQSQAELETLRAKADQDIIQLRSQIEAQIPAKARAVLGAVYQGFVARIAPAQAPAVNAIVQQCIGRFGTAGTDAACFDALHGIPNVAALVDPLLETAAALDQDVTTVLQTADEATLLAASLYGRSRDILASPEKQAEIYTAFAASISAQENPFEPRRDNPALLPSEQKLDMQYADAVQGFALAPWNAVPLRADDHFDADLSAATMIPILDVGGIRIQWGRSRFAEVRGALGVGVIQTEAPDSTSKKAGFLPNASLGIGTFRVGVGLATGKGLGDAGERTRLLVGIDLFKLISGSNVEAF